MYKISIGLGDEPNQTKMKLKINRELFTWIGKTRNYLREWKERLQKGALVKGQGILFPGPPQQCTENGVTSNSRNVWSHSPGSQKSGIKVLAGPRTLWWLHGRSRPCLFWLPVFATHPGVPWLVRAALRPCGCPLPVPPLHPSSVTVCLCVLIFPLHKGWTRACPKDLILLSYFCKTLFPNKATF